MDNDDYNEEFDHENISEDKKLNRPNPNSGMSVRGAKKIWFSPRKSGRPNKEYSDKLQEAKNVLLSAGESLKRTLIRKKNKINNLIRPRGRPKKIVATITKEKRPRGRPRKNPAAPELPKRSRGRPRKHPTVTTDKIKRPRGRPRKNPEILDQN